MDILTGEEANRGGPTTGAMNQHATEEDNVQSHLQYGNDQEDEECPRYMLAGTLTFVRFGVHLVK